MRKQYRPAHRCAPPPRATYRLQFHEGFTFDDAAAIVPYLARLGVSHVYASPIHRARPGYTHGYDIVDHTAINPELGGEEADDHDFDMLLGNNDSGPEQEMQEPKELTPEVAFDERDPVWGGTVSISLLSASMG